MTRISHPRYAAFIAASSSTAFGHSSAVGLQVFDPRNGALLGIMPKPGDGPLVSAGFGGKELDQLYVACGDKLYRRKTKVKGATPPTPR